MLALALAAAGALTCGRTDSVIVDVGGHPDTLVVASQLDTAVVTKSDTTIGSPDTVVVTVFDTTYIPADTVVVTVYDTTFSPPDTVLLTIVDTVVSGTDTTLVTTVDTLVTVDTVVVSQVDTVVSIDTVVVSSVDTVVTVDTVVVVDTLNVTTTLVASVSSLSLQVGQTATLSVTSQNALGFPTTPSSVTWLSGDESIATVDSNGKVTAIAPGSTSIFALAAGLSATVPTTVISPPAPPPPPSTTRVVLFNSDWSSGTGTGNTAVKDLGKSKPWTVQNGTGTTFEVRSTASDGRDYPTTNYLRVSNTYAELAFGRSAGYIDVPQVGQSIYLRMYYRVTLNGGGEDTHGTYFDDDPIAGVNWGPQALGIYLIPSTSTPMTFLISAAAGQDPRYFSPGARLNKNQTYRIELRYTRTGTNTYTLGGRIYDVTGKLLYDEGAFKDDYWYNGTPKLLGRTFTVSGAGASSMTGLKIGVEAAQPGTGAFAEYAGIAVCTGDWCGPYSGGM